MTEEDKVAALEATEKELQLKQAELEASAKSAEEKKSELEALEKEEERVKTDIVSAKEERRRLQVKDQSFQEKMRGENLESAKIKFFEEFGYAPEAQAKFLEEFKVYDSQSVSSDLIYRDMVRTHVAQNPEKYIRLEKEVKRLSKESDVLSAALSASGFTGVGEGVKIETEGLTPDDIRAAEWAHMPLPLYKKYKDEGKI